MYTTQGRQADHVSQSNNTLAAQEGSCGPHGNLSMVDNPLYALSSQSEHYAGRRPAPSLAWQPHSSHQTALHTHHHDCDTAEAYIQALLPTQSHVERKLKWFFWATMFCIVAHIIVTGYTDPFLSDNQTLQILVAVLQIVLLVLSMMAFFVLSSQTVAVRLGRYDLYLIAFRWLYLVWLLELALVIACKVYYIVLVLDHYTHLELWRQTGYYGLWVAQRLVLCVYWVAIAYNSFKALDHKHYDPNQLVTRGH